MPPIEKQVFPREFPEGLKPRLRLFLSVDTVGSTALKQSHQQAWRPNLLNFYRDFDHTLYLQFKTRNARSGRPAQTPEFWKSNGDELLYTCELTSLEQAHQTIQVWLQALHSYRAKIIREPERMDVKSTAWVGLFPTPNTEVFFRRGDARFRAGGLDNAVLLQAEMRDDWYANRNKSEISRDFVGPSIDTGFRLTAWASPRRFIMSVDLAFLLTSPTNAADEPLPLHFSGREKLKGIIDDQPYPMIWIPVGGRENPVDPSVGRHMADPAVLRSYCEAIIEQNYRVITPIFLTDGVAYEDFDWTPPYIIKDVQAQWREELAHKATASAPLRQAG